MRLYFTKRFEENLKAVPAEVQRAFAKQAILLAQDLRHPSLRAKKYDQTGNVWQARVNRNWRFYFTIENDTYILRNIIAHPK